MYNPLKRALLVPFAWAITNIANINEFDVWVSDGNPVLNVTRGGPNTSTRLIVQTQGFLDVTMISANGATVVDLNGARFVVDSVDISSDNESPSPNSVLPFNLTLLGNGSFVAMLDYSSSEDSRPDISVPFPMQISQTFKPFPELSGDDAEFLQNMIAQKYVPYQNAPDEPGKSDEEIRKLGLQFFPWTPYSYELAMSVYDWTTASFARMVFMKIFQYTSIPETPLPLDLASIAEMIWESDWDSYTPSDPDYMNSFMMTPANSLENVTAQLNGIYNQLQRFSDVENRLLMAAVQSLPRTSILAKPYLFSGQVDIAQMGVDRFGIEMLEFPGNAGPVGTPLEVEFSTALASFVKPGSTITTKMVWSFTDSVSDAMHYSNGILLVVEPPEADSLVWDSTAYITDLSNGPTKIEYVFPPGSRFLVLSVEPALPITTIRLRVHSVSTPLSEGTEALRHTNKRFNPTMARSAWAAIATFDKLLVQDEPSIEHVKRHRYSGRRCRCVVKSE